MQLMNLYFGFFLIVISTLVLSFAFIRRLNKKTARLALNKSVAKDFCLLERGIFRLYYTNHGVHAVARHMGDDDGECPARVEDVARQLEVAHHVFCNISGFCSPLQSQFFPHVRSINVYFFNRAALNGGHGLSFSFPSKLNDPYDKEGSAGIIYIANDLPTDNLTPAHELFHQIQNAMTNMKNIWFFEGMARWSQALFEVKPVSKSEIPPDLEYESEDDLFLDKVYAAVGDCPKVNPLAYQAEYPLLGVPDLLDDQEILSLVMESSYDAAFLLWFPLAEVSPKDSICLPKDDPILRLKYSDGTPVLKTSVLRGTRMMRTILEGLAEAEVRACRENEYKGKWTKKISRDPRNNPYILEVVRQTATRLCP